ncbi:hypothetical protein CYMTET_8979, partial [Cymbomonas tetramitiformis]
MTWLLRLLVLIWRYLRRLLRPRRPDLSALQELLGDERFPVSLASHRRKSRHFVSQRLVMPGETIVECSPYAAVVLDANIGTHCHACYCLLREAQEVNLCTCDCARYCSESCMQYDSDIHKEECFLLSQ